MRDSVGEPAYDGQPEHDRGHHQDDQQGTGDPEALPAFGTAQQRHRTAIAHRASCQPMKNHGDPRQVVTSATFSGVGEEREWREQPQRGEGRRVRMRQGRERHHVHPAEDNQEWHEPAPGKRTQRPNATPNSGPPRDGTTIWLTRTAIRAGGLNAPYSRASIGQEMQEREQGQHAAEQRHDRDRADRGGAGRQRGRGDTDDRFAVAHGAGQPEHGHHAEPAQEDRRVFIPGVDLGDRGVRAAPRGPRGHHHGEQEDRVDDEAAQLPDGERHERAAAGGRFGRVGASVAVTTPPPRWAPVRWPPRSSR